MSGVLQVCPVTCPVGHHDPGGKDGEPFPLTRLPMSPGWNGGAINRLDAAIQRDPGRLEWAVQQGQLNPCPSPEVPREAPASSEIRIH